MARNGLVLSALMAVLLPASSMASKSYSDPKDLLKLYREEVFEPTPRELFDDRFPEEYEIDHLSEGYSFLNQSRKPGIPYKKRDVLRGNALATFKEAQKKNEEDYRPYIGAAKTYAAGALDPEESNQTEYRGRAIELIWTGNRLAMQSNDESAIIITLEELAVAHYSFGEYDNAKQVTDWWIKYHPSARAHHSKALIIYGEAGEADDKKDHKTAHKHLNEARDAWEKGIELYPNDPKLLLGLGAINVELLEYDKALPYLTKAYKTTKNPTILVDVLYYLGEGAYGKKQYLAAAGHYGAARDIQPESHEILLGLGKSYMHLQMFKEAMTAFKKSAELDPGDGEAEDLYNLIKNR